MQIFAGEYAGVRCPTAHYSELVGLDVEVRGGSRLTLDLNAGYEHALLLLGGDCRLRNEAPLDEHTLYYLGTRRSEIELSSEAGSRILLIGGQAFPETLLMWWNFVARTPEEIAEARTAWEEQRGFGEIRGEHGPRLPAPDLVRFARPNLAS